MAFPSLLKVVKFCDVIPGAGLLRDTGLCCSCTKDFAQILFGMFLCESRVFLIQLLFSLPLWSKCSVPKDGHLVLCISPVSGLICSSVSSASCCWTAAFLECGGFGSVRRCTGFLTVLSVTWKCERIHSFSPQAWIQILPFLGQEWIRSGVAGEQWLVLLWSSERVHPSTSRRGSRGCHLKNTLLLWLSSEGGLLVGWHAPTLLDTFVLLLCLSSAVTPCSELN